MLHCYFYRKIRYNWGKVKKFNNNISELLKISNNKKKPTLSAVIEHDQLFIDRTAGNGMRNYVHLSLFSITLPSKAYYLFVFVCAYISASSYFAWENSPINWFVKKMYVFKFSDWAACLISTYSYVCAYITSLLCTGNGEVTK